MTGGSSDPRTIECTTKTSERVRSDSRYLRLHSNCLASKYFGNEPGNQSDLKISRRYGPNTIGSCRECSIPLLRFRFYNNLSDIIWFTITICVFNTNTSNNNHITYTANDHFIKKIRFRILNLLILIFFF